MPNEPGMDKHHVPQKAVMKKLDPDIPESSVNVLINMFKKMGYKL